MEKRRERLRLRPEAIYDIETADNTEQSPGTTFLCGVIYYVETRETYAYTWRDEEKLARAILNCTGEVWAHSGGTFDHKWLLRWAVRLGIPCDLNTVGGRIVTGFVGETALRDSRAVFPMPLEKLTKVNNRPKYKCPIPFDKFSRAMSTGELATVLEYCARDCHSLAEALETCQSYADRHDLDISVSVGSSAWANLARVVGIPKSNLSLGEHEAIRQAYFGGRVEVFKLYSASVIEFDINSSYPAALVRTALPIGKRTWLNRRQTARSAYARQRPGIYFGRIQQPDTHVPTLPLRTPDRLLFPVGSFSGAWTLPELEYARSNGATFEVERAVIWEREAHVLRDWCKALYSLRKGYKFSDPNHPFTEWLKLYMNSATGKLGQNPKKRSVIVSRESPKAGWEELFPSLAYTYESESVPPCGYPHWAAYLTSSARIALHSQIISGGPGGSDVLYCDTDSVLSIQEREGVGEELGQWERKGPFRNFTAKAPKFYTYEIEDGKHKIRTKGFKIKSREEFERIASGEQASFDSIAGATEAFRISKRNGVCDPFTIAHRKRRVHSTKGTVGGRIVEPNGVDTRPPTVDGIKASNA